MSVKPIVYQQISWKAVIKGLVAYILILTGLMLLIAPPLIRWLKPEDTMMIWVGLALGLGLAIQHGARLFVLPKINRGVKLFKQGKYEDAMKIFEEMFVFYSRHPRIDGLRWLLRLDPCAMSYREISMINIAACHFHLGNAEQARQAYERALAEYPENIIAVNAMKSIKLWGSLNAGQAVPQEGPSSGGNQ